MRPADDSGYSNSDGITNVTTPAITGTADPNATVTLYDTDGTTVLGTTTADGSGNWSITSSTLGSGTHTLTVKQTDSSNNVSSASSGLTVTIDLTAPATPSAGPALSAISDSGTFGDSLTNVTTPIVTGNAEAGSTVTLYDTDGTTVLGTALANGSGVYSITSSTLSQGIHSLTVKATDAAGNASFASPAGTVTIDTTAPATPSAAPALTTVSDSGASSSDNITNVTTPTVTGTAEVGATVRLYDTNGTTVLGSAVADASGNYSITSSTLSQGIHSLTVKATDAAGNVSAASSARTVTIDTTAPVASAAPTLSAGSDSGASSSDNITNATTPTVTGTAEAGATVTLYDSDGTTVLGTTTANGSGNYSIISSTLSQGVHSLTVKATDVAGNTSSASPARTLTIDTTAPVVSAAPVLSAGSDTGTLGDDVTNATTPTVTGTAEAGAIVRLYDTDGTTVLGTAVANGSGNYSITSSTLSQGVHSLTVKATDVAGNTSTASAVRALTIDTTAPTAPSAAPILTAGSDSGTLGDNVTGVTTPTVTGTAEAGSTVTLYDTNGTTVLGTGLANGSGVYSITSSTLSQGVHSLTVKATDVAGNVGAASPARTLTIDTTAPIASVAAPALTAGSDSGMLGDNVTNVATPTLTGIAEAGSTVRLYDTDGTTVLGTAIADGLGAYSITSSTLAQGSHSLTVKATDAAGNVGAASPARVLTINTAVPQMTAALLNDTGSSATDRITDNATLTGNGDANAVVTIREGSVTLGTATADAQGHWTFAPSGLALGVHTLVASETNAAGNTGTVQIGFRLDAQSAAAPADFISTTARSIGLARFFDTTNGTQFYTSSQSEYDTIMATRPGLKQEGNDLNALNPNSVATDPDALPVYRFFDSVYGTHFFTTDAGERDSVIASRPDLKFEGVGFFEHATPHAGDTAVYRFFDTVNGTHTYTTNENERSSILSTRPDLKDEGIGFYAPKLS